MPNIERDLRYLQLLCDGQVACESISVFDKSSDFISYYFKRFLINLTHTFKDFSKSELTLYEMRYHTSIDKMLSDPLLKFDSTIVPVPKGMLESYKKTTDVLVSIIKEIDTENVYQVLKSINSTSLQSGSILKQNEIYTKKKFDQTVFFISSTLYSKRGISFSLSEKVLVSSKDVRDTLTTLSDFIDKEYPLTIEINKEIAKSEKEHINSSLDEDSKAKLFPLLMSIAYKLSLLGVCLDHIQSLEHNFVKCLDILLKKSYR